MGRLTLAGATLLLVVVLGVTGCAQDTGSTDAGPPHLGPRTAADATGWGFTHTERSADGGDAAAGDRVADELAAHPMMQAQAIMGWGADNPEPSPGVWNFASLDHRIDFIRRSGGTPVITLCGAPDWMKGGTAGKTNWRRIEAAPTPDHYADFARLAAVVARRYPDVHRYVVWNEFKGFFDDDANTWDAAGYTDMYNRVHDALKAVNPDLQVGGPYLDMAAPKGGAGPSALSGSWGSVDQRTLDAFDYWDEHKVGADFVAVDGHATTDDGASDPVAALDKFDAVTRWVADRARLPVWWTEWYVEPRRSGWSDEQKVAMRAAAMVRFARSGAATALYWNAEDDHSWAGDLWSPTDGSADDGSDPPGTGGPFLDVLERFGAAFPPGTRFGDLPVPPGVDALATGSTALLVNLTDRPAQAAVDGHEVDLAPWAVSWVAR